MKWDAELKIKLNADTITREGKSGYSNSVSAIENSVFDDDEDETSEENILELIDTGCEALELLSLRFNSENNRKFNKDTRKKFGRFKQNWEKVRNRAPNKGSRTWKQGNKLIYYKPKIGILGTKPFQRITPKRQEQKRQEYNRNSSKKQGQGKQDGYKQ